MSKPGICYPPQYNHRTDQGSGGTNVRVFTDNQRRLVDFWSGYDCQTLAYMLLNHMTVEEQDRFVAVYKTSYRQFWD